MTCQTNPGKTIKRETRPEKRLARTKLAMAILCSLAFAGAHQASAATEIVIDTPVSKSTGNTDAVSAADNASVIVTPTGSITTTGNGSNAIVTGDFSSVTNNGAITTTGAYTGTDLSNAHFSDGIFTGQFSSVTNNGTVNTSGNSAYAIYAKEGSVIVNNGNVTTAGDNANGLMGENGTHLINNGDVSTSGKGSYGMRGKDNAILINSGSVSTTGSTENDPFDLSTNSATAMQGGDRASLTNSGTLHTTGDGSSGMAAKNDSILVNTGSIVVEGDSILAPSYVFADGMMGGERANLTNAGTITTLGESVYGLYSNTGSTLTNTGSIRTEGKFSDGMTGENHTRLVNDGIIHVLGDAASGMYGKTGSGVINNGTIVVDSNISDTHPVDSIAHHASGMTVRGDSASVFNNGQIDTAGQAAAGAIHVEGKDNLIGNTGTINVHASNGVGISVQGQNVTVFNTGTIHTGTTGPELYLPQTASTPSDVTVTAWATGIDRQNVFSVEANNTLNFGNTRLIFRAPSDASVLDKPFAVNDMVTLQPGANLTGAIGSASSVMPMLAVNLEGTDIATQTVRMSVDARNSYGQQANVANVRNAQNRLWLSNRVIANALTDANAVPSSQWSAFGQSYHLGAGATGDARSSSESTGFILGATKNITPHTSLGFHVGYERTDMDAKGMGVTSTSDSWIAGLHGNYRFADKAFIRGQLTGMVSSSDYDFNMLGDSASSDRTEYAFFANVTGGYDFRVNDSHTITPEIGLAYLYLNNPSLDAKWSAVNTGQNIHFDSDHYSAAFATAALRWMGDFKAQAFNIKPAVALGVRQTLTNGKIDSGMQYLSNRYRSYITDDRTVGTIEAGLTFTQKNMSMSIRYNGNFGSDTHDNVIWGEFGYSF